MKDAFKDKKMHAWVTELTEVPVSVIEKMARADESMYSYASPSLRLIASPTVTCESCLYTYDGDSTATTPVERKGELRHVG